MIDTNVFVSGVISGRGGAARQVMQLALAREIVPLFSEALFCEYEDVAGRTGLWRGSPIDERERTELRMALYAVSEWVQIYYLWRPNLADEADNHIWELAVAGGATAIVTSNLHHLRSDELKFPHIAVVTAHQFIKEAPWQPSH